MGELGKKKKTCGKLLFSSYSREECIKYIWLFLDFWFLQIILKLQFLIVCIFILKFLVWKILHPLS